MTEGIDQPQSFACGKLGITEKVGCIAGLRMREMSWWLLWMSASLGGGENRTVIQGVCLREVGWLVVLKPKLGLARDIWVAIIFTIVRWTL
jgi:hypothetical protein